jgi:hypothetical protein
MNEHNIKMMDFLRSMYWGGPEVYDEHGVLKIPTFKEIDRYRNLYLSDIMDETSKQYILQIRRAKGIKTPHYDSDYWETVQYV